MVSERRFAFAPQGLRRCAVIAATIAYLAGCGGAASSHAVPRHACGGSDESASAGPSRELRHEELASWSTHLLPKGTPIGALKAKGKGKSCTKDMDCPGEELCEKGACALPPGAKPPDEKKGDPKKGDPKKGDPKKGDPKKEVVITKEAKEHFARGVAQLEAEGGPKYREAWKAFRDAYKASPSPKILSNLGATAMMVERDGEAIEAYELYLAELQGIDPRERSKINNDLQVLWARVTPVEVTVKPQGAKIIDERTPEQGDPIVNEYGPVRGKIDLGLREGKHRLRVELDGYEPTEWTFDAEAGKPRSKSVTLKKKGGAKGAPAAATGGAKKGPTGKTPEQEQGEPEEPSAGVPTSVWVMMGVTGALAIGGGVVGILALDSKSTYESYQDGGDREDAEVVRSNGETLNIVTDVLLGAAIAAGATTLILFLTSGPDSPEEAEDAEESDEAKSASWRIAPSASPHGAGLTIGTTF